MSIFDEMDDPAQVRAHLAHWRAHVADPARADDFLGLLQDRQIVERLERKLVELEQAPVRERDVLAEQNAERCAYFVTTCAPTMRSKEVIVHPDGSWTMTFEPIEDAA